MKFLPAHLEFFQSLSPTAILRLSTVPHKHVVRILLAIQLDSIGPASAGRARDLVLMPCIVERLNSGVNPACLAKGLPKGA